MKRTAGRALACAVLLAGCSQDAPSSRHDVARPLPVCNDAQLQAMSIQDERRDSHRLFDPPVLRYAASQRLDPFGYRITVRVDEQGRVVCFAPDKFDNDPVITPQRQAAIAEASRWRYRPFAREGKPTSAVVGLTLREERLPSVHRPMPDGPPSSFRIRLRRGPCFGDCAVYTAEIRGDGEVTYVGERFVGVTGTHVHRVPAEAVEDLIARLRGLDVWSMEPEYVAQVTDNPTFDLEIEIAGQRHAITDYVGQRVGMPQAVSEVEDAVDRIANTAQWVTLSRAVVDQLEQAGFDFRSQAGADLLARAASNPRNHDEGAMLRLIALGAPLDGGHPGRLMDEQESVRADALLSASLRARHLGLLQPMLDRGALLSRGHLDQAKLDLAFQAAIAGGRLAPVQALWALAAPRTPGLFYREPPDRYDEAQRKNALQPSSVLMLLVRDYDDEGWQGREIAQWLQGQGADLHARSADGDTLLHIAARAGDADFVRYLLTQGLDADTRGRFDLPALGSATHETVALLLLQAGSSWAMDDQGRLFIARAHEQGWQRVLDYIRQHPGQLGSPSSNQAPPNRR